MHGFGTVLLEDLRQAASAIDACHESVVSQPRSRIGGVKRVSVAPAEHHFIRGAVLGLTLLKMLKKATKKGLETDDLRRCDKLVTQAECAPIV